MRKWRTAVMVIGLMLLISSPVFAQEGAAAADGSMSKGLIGLGAGLDEKAIQKLLWKL